MGYVSCKINVYLMCPLTVYTRMMWFVQTEKSLISCGKMSLSLETKVMSKMLLKYY